MSLVVCLIRQGSHRYSPGAMHNGLELRHWTSWALGLRGVLNLDLLEFEIEVRPSDRGDDRALGSSASSSSSSTAMLGEAH